MALTSKLTAVADAIRAKTGKGDPLTLDQMPPEIASIPSGGGERDLSTYSPGELFERVSFYDFDGTLVDTITVEEAKALAAMPEGPDRTSEGIEFASWNYTLADMAHVEPGCEIGALYKTTRKVDGRPAIVDMTIVPDVDSDGQPRTALFYLTMACEHEAGVTVLVDWGDGSEPEEAALTADMKRVSHYYPSTMGADDVFHLCVAYAEGQAERAVVFGTASVSYYQVGTGWWGGNYMSAAISRIAFGDGEVRLDGSTTGASLSMSFANEVLLNESVVMANDYSFECASVTPSGTSAPVCLVLPTSSNGWGGAEEGATPPNLNQWTSSGGFGKYVYPQAATCDFGLTPNSYTRSVYYPPNVSGLDATWNASVNYPSLRTVRFPKDFNPPSGLNFQYCRLLSRVHLGDSLTAMPQFSELAALDLVVFPKDVGTVTPGALQGCYGLNSVALLTAGAPSYDWLSNTSGYVNFGYTGSLYVLDGAVADWRAYCESSGYPQYVDFIRPLSEMPGYPAVLDGHTVPDYPAA